MGRKGTIWEQFNLVLHGLSSLPLGALCLQYWRTPSLAVFLKLQGYADNDSLSPI